MILRKNTCRCNVAASKHYVALALRCGCVVPAAEWLTRMQWALHS